jgi:hypothetical protein
MIHDLDRKVREKYGAREYHIVESFVVPDEIEGGDGVCYTIQFTNNGDVSVWLRTNGLYYESDRVELENYLAKTPVWPAGAIAAIALLGATKHRRYVDQNQGEDVNIG